MLTVHQEELLEYFNLCLGRFTSWIKSNQTQLIGTDIFKNIQSFLDTELHKRLDRYSNRSAEYQDILDLIIELNIMSKDSSIFHEMLKQFTQKI